MTRDPQAVELPGERGGPAKPREELLRLRSVQVPDGHERVEDLARMVGSVRAQKAKLGCSPQRVRQLLGHEGET
jgi:hypothetical protein